MQRRSGGVGVLGDAHGHQQHQVSNSRQTVLQQRHAEGQGQQQQHSGEKVLLKGLRTFSDYQVCCVCVQPDGAESIASLYSSDTASDKRAASQHTHNSGPPTISISRASESSGTDQHLQLLFVLCDFIKQLLTSHTKAADAFKALLTFASSKNSPVRTAGVLGERPAYWNKLFKSLSLLFIIIFFHIVICLKINLGCLYQRIIAANMCPDSKGDLWLSLVVTLAGAPLACIRI